MTRIILRLRKEFCFNKTAYSFLYSCFFSTFLCGVLEEHTFTVIMHKAIKVHRCFISRQPIDECERKKPQLNRCVTANVKALSHYLIDNNKTSQDGRSTGQNSNQGIRECKSRALPLVSLIRDLYIIF